MPAAMTIPLLPAISMDASLAFWQALGYEVRMRQRAPNAYAVIRCDDVELHLFGLAELDPETNFSTCLVVLDDVEVVHERLEARLRDHLGRAPYRNLPRLSRMRPGQSRFTLTDVAGNSVIHVKRGPEDDEAADAYKRRGQTPLQRGLALAERKRDFETDDAGAARVLDKLLDRHEGDSSPDYRRAVAARLELAEVLEETARAAELRELTARSEHP